MDLAEQLLDVYDLERADQLLSAAEHDSTVGGAAGLVRLQWLLHARPDEAVAAIDSQLPAMLEQLTRAGDDPGLAKAHTAGQWVHWLAGRATAAGEQAGLAAAHARAAGDERLHARALSYEL